MSSSGFVPFPSSKRDEKEYGPSNAPLPSFMVPLPCFSVPSQTADPVRVAIFSSFNCLRFARDACQRKSGCFHGSDLGVFLLLCVRHCTLFARKPQPPGV